MLPSRPERPSRRATEQRDQLPPLHSITSSARCCKNQGDLEAERLRGLEIDDKLELCRLQHRQISGLGPFKDATGVEASLPYRFGLNRSVADQAAIPDILAKCVDGRNAVASCESRSVGRGD